jgi:secreted Zn-dependent insulinase-like peptidase
MELTVEHILLQCASFTKARDDFFSVTVTSLSELFSKVAPRSLIDYIKETGWFFNCMVLPEFY